MPELHPKSIRMKSDDSRLGALRYSRAYTLTIEALHTMCCEAGTMRERLQQVDPEFFALKSDDLPESEDVRTSFEQFHQMAARLEPRWKEEGQFTATLGQSHHTNLKAMAQLVWDIHRDFSRYMQSDA